MYLMEGNKKEEKIMIYAYMLENTNKYLEVDNTALIKLLHDSKVVEDNVYIDRIDDNKRPSLRMLSEIIKSNDILIVRSLADLTNNIRDLTNALNYLHNNNITLISAVEYYYTYESFYQAFIDFSSIPAHWREQKRLLGIEKASMEKRMGRKKDTKKIETALKLYDKGFKIQEIVDISNISRSTLYREINRRKLQA